MKKVISIILVACMLLCLCSCGNDDEIAEYKKEIKELKEKVEALENELGFSYDDLVSDDGVANPSGVKISMNEAVTVDDVIEFSVTSWEFLDEIRPANPNGGYMYISDESGAKFLVIKGTITNLNSESYDVDDIIVPEIKINGKYEFSGHAKAEELDGSDFAYDTLPLEENNLILYISVSDNVADAFESGELTLYVANNPDTAGDYFNADDDPHNVYKLDI